MIHLLQYRMHRNESRNGVNAQRERLQFGRHATGKHLNAFRIARFA